jgi:hypothetical protein
MRSVEDRATLARIVLSHAISGLLSEEPGKPAACAATDQP